MLLIWSAAPLCLPAQSLPLEQPAISAVTKGPNQINLTWPPVSSPGYGFLIEIQSDDDERYLSWKALQPIPTAKGYTCDPAIVFNGGRCSTSDPSGLHVYNSPTNGVPYWVTDSTYIDPLDDSPAQFIASSLKPNTTYSFRVRSYSGNSPTPGSSPPVVSPYSDVVTAATADYTLRYVSPSGDDSNDGTSADSSHAWRTIGRGAASLQCGQALIVMGGNYATDGASMGQVCTTDSRAVVMANPGDKVVITSLVPFAESAINLSGSYLIVDGITSANSSGRQAGDYDVTITGSRNALFNIEVSPPVIPTFAQYGVIIYGDHNLLSGCYLHDYHSPERTQNPDGGSGYVLTVYGTRATYNVIRSNHLTRGGHDVSLCKAGCSYNRWLNNVMDGGWGSGWMVIGAAGNGILSGHNLFEGNFIKDVGQLTPAYKPAIEVSSALNTVRRNISVNSASRDLEISAIYLGDLTVGVLVYNNTFYSPVGCIFHSVAGGVDAYDDGLYANNICFKVRGLATDIYLGNTKSKIAFNSFLGVDQLGRLQPEQPMFIWNHNAQSTFQYPVTLKFADSQYNPPFADNSKLSVNPLFVDERLFDFSLRPDSPLISAGTPVTDPEWGNTVGNVDVGAFGIVMDPTPPDSVLRLPARKK